MTARRRDDRGAGLISTLVGLTAFLVLLFFAVQLLTNLYATSVVTSAAYDAAHQAATHGHTPNDAELADAEDRARDLLGRYGDRAHFDWSGTDNEVVRLRIQVTNPRFVAMVPLVGFDAIDRTVSVRIEQVR